MTRTRGRRERGGRREKGREREREREREKERKREEAEGPALSAFGSLDALPAAVQLFLVF